MTFYQILLELSTKQTKIIKGKQSDFLSFDLKHKTIRSGKLLLVDKGQIVVNKLSLCDGTKYDLDNIDLISDDLSDLQSFNQELYQKIVSSGVGSLNILRSMFLLYNTSVPSESDRFRNCYFATKDIDSITDYELVTGLRRSTAQYMLEGYILLSSCKGLEWSENERWFKKIAPNFVLLKEWCW